ncbi:hypothetical protein TRVA0_017S02652 [Trichomonascus vanleenenianus]|uniref:uncharacterized protein n=1 Tax=Trichomonascus vanleenenianus TaxID=2268995 RepID=UPI003ECB1D09
MVDDSALTANLTIAPGYKIPGWSETAEATAEFKNDGGLECPLPGCNRLFKDVLHGRRYTAERWKAHVLTREAHTYLWYNPERCYQPRSLENTFIRVDRRYRIAVCHFRREPVSPKKFDDHCRRCQKCIAVQHEFDNDDDFRSITYVSEQVIKREKMAVYGFEPCYAYFCCSRLHGINQQSMYIHSQTPGNHNPSNLIKCLRYRTSRHGYAYNPVSDYDFEMADMVTDGMMVTTIEDQPHGGAPQLSTVAAASSSSPVDPESSTSAEVRAGTPQEGQLLPIPVAQQWAQDLSLSTMPLSRAAFQGVCNEHGIGLFKQFYSRLISNCISRLDDATWNLHNDVVARWGKYGEKSHGMVGINRNR